MCPVTCVTENPGRNTDKKSFDKLHIQVKFNVAYTTILLMLFLIE